jgi:transcriptional regulator with XRE-family HTH domain
MVDNLLDELKLYMKNNNLTQKKLAILLGVNQPQISRIFSKKRQPSANLIDRIEKLIRGE